MNRKDFEFIAKMLREISLSDPMYSIIVNSFSNKLDEKYSNFDSGKFINACGKGRK